MLLIHETKDCIIQCLDGDRISSVCKDDIEDFDISTNQENGIISFITISGNDIAFIFPNAIDFDNAIDKLIKITDCLGI